jgi:hypothetical protein
MCARMAKRAAAVGASLKEGFEVGGEFSGGRGKGCVRGGGGQMQSGEG